ncbi:MAG: TolC family protein [Candidatus Omnitrophica bacterium]|nr:TolC family protein [Candidatus Omnitrophota bacterium]MDD5237335.1 TolC family protein [Candidatus Omnitrophota bacterium]
MKKKIIKVLIISLFLSFFLHQLSADEILTWNDCLAEAKKNHPDLISAQENINQEKANKTITASGLYPQIDSSLDASTGKTTATSSTTGTTTSTVADSYSYGVSGTQLIFDGFKTINQVNSAKENIKSAQQNYRFVSSGVRLDLRTAFINLLKAQELISVTEEIIRIRRNNLVLITLRYESGLEHRGALWTAEADLAQANLDLAQAKRDVVLAQRQLTKEMGRKEFKPVSAKGDFSVRDSAKEKPDFEILAKYNPSLLQLVAKKNAASFDIKSAYADFAPQLSGSAAANRTNAHWPPQNDNWNLGLSVTMPVFEGGLRLAQVSKAKAAYNQAQADERSTRDGIVVTLEQAWANLQDAIETVEVQRKSLEAAKERAKIAEAQYSTGFISYDNWTIIEDNLVNGKLNYLNAESNALYAEANWINAKGETLEYAP